MQNIKRRSEIDLANAYKYDGFDLMEKLLPILDNFERAISIKQEGTEKVRLRILKQGEFGIWRLTIWTAQRTDRVTTTAMPL